MGFSFGRKKRQRCGTRPIRSRFRRLKFEQLESRQLLTAEISGIAWHDVNANGLFDVGQESPQSGITVYLDANLSGSLDGGENSTVTLQDGSYSFVGLSPGTYHVAQVLPNGFVQTHPTGSVQSIVDEVSQSQYQTFHFDVEQMGLGLYGGSGYNQGVRNRDGTSGPGSLGNQETRLYLQDQFTAMGLDVSLQGPYLNVVAELPGTTTPDNIYIIGAHYDHISGDSPGGDDNASGTAGLLEAARILSQYQFESTIRFIGFNAEEDGLLGSHNYVHNQVIPNGEVIKGMINLDMILRPSSNSSPGAPIDLDLGTRTNYAGSVAWAQAFRAAAAEYVPELVVDATIFHVDGRSDQDPFVLAGIPAFLAIENTTAELSSANPYYHTTGDASDRGANTGAVTYNYAFATDVAQASVGLLADQAVFIASSHRVTLGENAVLSNIDFGSFLPGQIQGTIWIDQDGDNSYDVGVEQPQVGVSVYIDANHNGQFDNGERTAVTNASGTYTLADVPEGTHTVAQVVPQNYVQTFPSVDPRDHVETIRVASGLSSPLYATTPDGDTGRLFIVEKGGRIRILNLGAGTVNTTPFLNISGLVSTGSEQGLLGLAFDPGYSTNGFFYIAYTNTSGTSVIARYQVSGDPNVANAGSGLTLLTIGQPFANHNGGWIDFGPDGYLYYASGDGGSGGDPLNNAQTITNNLLGKMLRIDVNGTDNITGNSDDDAFPGDPNRNYSNPSSNPFVGKTGDDEIWSYGLRNPWRPSFDRVTGDLYIADVGQGAHEEINFQPAANLGGENYAWNRREGTADYQGGASLPGDVGPIYDYLHGNGSNQGYSVTGGYVYRGPISFLDGKYFFADYVTERIWSVEYDSGTATDFLDWTTALTPDVGTIDSIASFAEDASGNLYVIDLGGEVFRVSALGTPGTHDVVLTAGGTVANVNFGNEVNANIQIIDNPAATFVGSWSTWSTLGYPNGTGNWNYAASGNGSSTATYQFTG
ncbi:MAG: M28 family peptidase, partial [Planctomycetes bacterium]|nr:M28 family peptidase [Planctomycetota bacterium]